MMKITGVIVRRRVLGKNLAFCHVQRQETQQQQEEEEEGELMLPGKKENNQQEDGGAVGDITDIVRVAFRRSSDAWDSTRDETFPTKVSRLPYGATVLMELQSPKQQPEGQQHQQQQDWEVCSWQILVHPDIVAQTTSAVVDKNNAQNNDKNVIVSVPAYLRARGQMYMDLHPEKRPKKVKKIQQEPTTTTTITTYDPNPHGDAHAKCQRANVFCQWLIETFGQEMLQNTTVLDVASGKGQLSIELACSSSAPCAAAGGVRCIMVDPMIRGERHDPTSTTSRATKTKTVVEDDDDDSFQILGKRARKRIQKAGGPLPVFLAAYFDDEQFVRNHADIMQNCGLLVGLHPDQCTEAIVNVALRLQKSFAVVPCCVFGDLFPVRMLRQIQQPTTSTTTGNLDLLHVAAAPAVPVRTYEQFLQYLCEKDPRIQQATLPVCGKNQVLYLQQ